MACFDDFPPRRTTYVAWRAGGGDLRDGPFVLDAIEGRLLERCDGSKTVGEISEAMLLDEDFPDRTRDSIVGSILHLFEIALLRLDQGPVSPQNER